MTGQVRICFKHHGTQSWDNQNMIMAEPTTLWFPGNPANHSTHNNDQSDSFKTVKKSSDLLTEMVIYQKISLIGTTQDLKSTSKAVLFERTVIYACSKNCVLVCERENRQVWVCACMCVCECGCVCVKTDKCLSVWVCAWVGVRVCDCESAR